MTASSIRKAVGSVLCAVALLGLGACAGSDQAETATTSIPSGSTVAGEVTFRAEVWADNWFALYANGELVGEDSVPITTERSFNAEKITFTATYPLQLALVSKDYKADDSGLEYLGTSRQQMGDGGVIAQVHEQASGRLVAATGPTWRGLVIHRAPLDVSCEKAKNPAAACTAQILTEPAGWTDAGFDDSAWAAATTYTPDQVGTKDGYDDIRWERSASLIWSSSLKQDNTILWRAPESR